MNHNKYLRVRDVYTYKYSQHFFRADERDCDRVWSYAYDIKTLYSENTRVYTFFETQKTSPAIPYFSVEE